MADDKKTDVRKSIPELPPKSTASGPEERRSVTASTKPTPPRQDLISQAPPPKPKPK